ncbi:MAG: hypothetical protein IJ512_05390 [Ruminococcus sp.]|nr:hypothetical protein [Ruminococcus sp.]
MKPYRKHWLKYELPHLIPRVLLIALVVLMLGFVVFLVATYIRNYIDEGLVIDKDYDSAYTSIVSCSNGSGGTYFQTVYHPESYQFLLEGEKDGETVSCWISVPESEYDKYNIGDYYP